MARYINIYFGFTPNLPNNKYYCFHDQLAYLSRLTQQNYVRVDLDNYRITTGVIKVKKTSITSNIRNASYVVELTSGGTFLSTSILRCYHVRSFEELDYYVLHVETDLWGTYFMYANLSNINVLRCNRNIGTGIYDEVKHTDIETIVSTYQKPYIENSWLDDTGEWAFEDYVNIVFAVEYNVEQSVFGTDHISTTGMFCVSIKDLRSKAHADYAGLAGVLYGMDMVGGIFGVNASWGSPLDARILKAWILPNACIYKTGKTLTFKSKSIYAKNAQIDIVCEQVRPQRRMLQFRNIDVNPNKATYFGAYNNGIKLKNYTDAKLHTFLVCNVGVSDLNVIVMQGENQKDITNAFDMILTTNAGETTMLRQIAKAWGSSVNATRGIYSDFASGATKMGGVGGGIVNSALGFSKVITDMIPLTPQLESAIGGGDGATNYYGYHTTTSSGGITYYYVRNPFRSFIFDSIENEEAKARLYGASFNVFVSDLSTIDNNTLLGTGDLTDTYLIANLRVDGIPKEAKDYIENVFKNGFYMEYLH